MMLVTVTDVNRKSAQYAYQLAGIILRSYSQKIRLAHFRDESLPGASNSCSLFREEHKWLETYSGTGNMYSGNYRVTQRTSGSLIEIEVEDIGSMRICLKCNAMQTGTLLSAQADEIRDEFELGPGLMLLLAHNDCYAMHASAIDISEGVLVFCGESGQGKSTLAKELALVGGVKRLADDIVIWRLIEGVPHIYSFPQLKLDANDQAVFDAPKPIKGFYRLNTENDESGVSITEMNSAHQLIEAMRHTVVIRLYTESMQKGLIKALPLTLRSAPMQRLSYPKQMGSIDQVRELLEL